MPPTVWWSPTRAVRPLNQAAIGPPRGYRRSSGLCYLFEMPVADTVESSVIRKHPVV